MRNTFVIGFFAIGTLVTTLVAYGFSRINFWWIFFMVYLSTIMLPGQVTMIPLYILYSKLGWVGTILPLIVPTYFGSVAYVFMLRQFFRTIPNEFCMSSFHWTEPMISILWQIRLPRASAPAAIALLCFIGNYQRFPRPVGLPDQPGAVDHC